MDDAQAEEVFQRLLETISGSSASAGSSGSSAGVSPAPYGFE
jgi:hypothetical protein